jgi:orotate phosphoribosyltransferase
MPRTSGEWIELYKTLGALWIHDGNQKRPHALLTSKMHSSGFFNSELVMERPNLLDEASDQLVEELLSHPDFHHRIDRVVGPAMGAITLAHDVARNVEAQTELLCLRSYVEKDGERMVFKRGGSLENERTLLVEDVITTAKSVRRCAAAVSERRAAVLPFVLALVNRSGQTNDGERTIVSLINHHMPTWDVPNDEACPLCAAGSEAIRPKEGGNWERLNATY